jgi:hypothetical protein
MLKKIEGSIGDKALENRINKFKDLIRGAAYDDIDVVLTQRCKPFACRRGDRISEEN